MIGTAERKLTTIFCADVAGYSAMMDRDEDATLVTLKDYRGRMTAMIERHRGRVVNTAGDGLMAEFASPVESVRCATEIQRELGGCNANLPKHRKMEFRIGINLGDVMVDEGDLFGEGVNIAARLESIAQPGGILIASTVFDQVKSKLSVRFDFLGDKQVKNIAQGIPTYRVLIDPPDGPASQASSDWPGIGIEAEEEELASRAIPPDPENPADVSADAPFENFRGASKEKSRPDAHKAVQTAHLWLGKLVGHTDNEESKTMAKRSGLIGLALAAIALITPLDWLVWPAMMIAFAGAQLAIGKAGWGKRQGLRARIICLIALLFAINLVSSFGHWWFVYPAAVLGIIALMFGDGPRRWQSRDQSSQ